MPFLFDRLYGKLGAKYFGLYVVFEVVSACLVCLATLGLFALYTETEPGEFLRLVVVAEGAVLLAVAYAISREWQLARPIVAWVRAGRPDQDALGIWRCAVAMPRQLLVIERKRFRLAGCSRPSTCPSS
jgi:hypothetical protein